jgi:hypothetical protein
MELAITEVAVYTPPILIAGLFYLYRNSIFAFSNWNRIVPSISNQLMQRANQLIEILRIGSQFVFRVKNVLQVVANTMIGFPGLILRTLQEVFKRMQGTFQTVQIQVTNMTHVLYSNLTTFLFPPEKTSLERTWQSILGVTAVLTIVLCWWYLTSMKPKPSESEPVAEKKPVRRKQKKT